MDAITYGGPLAAVADEVAGAEARGYDGWFVGEVGHDPVLACALAAEHTERMEIGTAIAVAFPRSPMHLAYQAHDLQALARGRFVLGLGSQIKAHVEKRYSATWSAPAARMREFVLAMRAIWDAWATGERLRFEGEHYRHTLMTPFFTPDAHGFGHPKVWLAAFGPRMTAVAGEVTDGLLCHAFTTPRYLREVTLPALAEGTAAAGRDRAELEVSLPVFLVTGRDERERDEVAEVVRGQLAFYGSTPAYRGVLELHGWGELHEELHARSLRGEWAAMSALIDDEVLDTFAVVAEPDRVGAAIRDRYGDHVDRVSLNTSFTFDDDGWRRLVTELAR
ncbi:TIGR03617 family F420-dependent LLM class oxidoreductase [Nitriliruptoraceae bacterium ZYF776]|nr:TIGR03617 family F420-dependent LLM class oxidoreductase [Profundirhabdus halotolerans]